MTSPSACARGPRGLGASRVTAALSVRALPGLAVLPVLCALPVPAALAAPPAVSRAVAPADRPAVRPAPGGLPAVELLLDWRQVPSTDDPAPPGSAAGGFSVGTASPVPPGWSATRSRDAAPPAEVATVRVMNGHEAAWQFDRARVRRDHDLVWTAQGQGVVSRDTVVHDARSLLATPRWPGGGAPVAVDLAVGSSSPDSAGDRVDDVPADPARPATRDTGLRTTVALPLGDWVTVARVGAEDIQLRVRRH